MLASLGGYLRVSGCVSPSFSCSCRIWRCCRFIRLRSALSSRACSLARSGSGTRPRVTPANSSNSRAIRNSRTGIRVPAFSPESSLPNTIDANSHNAKLAPDWLCEVGLTSTVAGSKHHVDIPPRYGPRSTRGRTPCRLPTEAAVRASRSTAVGECGYQVTKTQIIH